MSSQLSTTKIVLKFLLICISFYLFLPVSEVYAGAVINRAPTSLGLISGLVGYWSFDGPDMAEKSKTAREGRFLSVDPAGLAPASPSDNNGMLRSYTTDPRSTS